MEGFLNFKIAPWKRVLITRSFAMVPTVLVAAFANPHVLGSLNEWMNILQSVQLPFAM
jgi:NRAMP (natural resistance-associated macrophage protein)-like metal ion transporter